MSNTEAVNVFTGDEAQAGPSIEDQYNALVAEGVISEENPVAQGGADGTAQGGEGGDRPAWLPEKFKSPEDLAKAYTELEKRMSSGPKETETPAPKEAPAEDPMSPEERAAAEAATAKAGLNLGELSQKWYANGRIDDSDYEALEKAGYPRDLVDVYIEGLAARSANVINEAYSLTGGSDGYNEMIQWAIDNLSEADQKAFDAEINSNDRSRVLRAIKALHADYSRAVAEATKDDSREPEAPVTVKGASVGGSRYETMDDYLADLNDPRYDTNESFRRQVMAKLARSNIM